MNGIEIWERETGNGIEIWDERHRDMGERDGEWHRDMGEWHRDMGVLKNKGICLWHRAMGERDGENGIEIWGLRSWRRPPPSHAVPCKST
jgi:hypothetical protein